MNEQTTPTATENGYMLNAKGDKICIKNIKEIDLIRDEEVKKMLNIAAELNKRVREDKKRLFDLFYDFVALSAQERGTQLGGKKGNITLTSFDGSQQVKLAISEYISFDEQLQIAKQLIDECILEWSKDSSDEIKTLVNQAFDVDKAGKISTTRVLGLRRLNIQSDKWQQAMDTITDSIQITGSRKYIRFYQRTLQDTGAGLGTNKKYQQILLDFSAI